MASVPLRGLPALMLVAILLSGLPALPAQAAAAATKPAPPAAAEEDDEDEEEEEEAGKGKEKQPDRGRDTGKNPDPEKEGEGEASDAKDEKNEKDEKDKEGDADKAGGNKAEMDGKEGEGENSDKDKNEKEKEEKEEEKEEDKDSGEKAETDGPRLELTLTWASNYIFRGVSMSDKLPVFQGSLDFSTPLLWGLSANIGIWRSMTRFESTDPAADPNADPPAPLLQVRRERGWYYGLSLELPMGLSWSSQIYNYSYPGFFDLNFDERAHTLSRTFEDLPFSPTLEIGRAKFRSVFYPGSDGRYYEVNLQAKLNDTWGLNFHIGRSRFADQSLGGQDYVDRSIAFVREVNGFQVEFVGSNTTTSQFGRLGSPAAFVRVSRSF